MIHIIHVMKILGNLMMEFSGIIINMDKIVHLVENLVLVVTLVNGVILKK